MTPIAVAAELNLRGMLRRRRGRWHVSTVTNLIERLGLKEAACVSRCLMSLVEAATNIAVARIDAGTVFGFSQAPSSAASAAVVLVRPPSPRPRGPAISGPARRNEREHEAFR
jgi:hypothetical protein